MQQDATVWDNFLFLGCSTCFERYFRSSSGASKLYYSFWYYTRMSLPAGIMGVLELSYQSTVHDVMYENDQQDATVCDNLLFLGCCTCFERYFPS